MNRLIGLTGLKRAGKDTVADYLVKSHGFVKYALAGPIKEALKTIFLWDDYQIEHRKEEVDPRWGISPRQAMQHMGTEWAQFDLSREYPEYGNMTGRKLWINRFAEWYQETGSEYNVVVSDVRFHHEAEVIRALGGEIVLVDRTRNAITDNHASERHVYEIASRYQISNTSSIKNLYEVVDELIADMDNTVDGFGSYLDQKLSQA